jgi:hypothetical protein
MAEEAGEDMRMAPRHLVADRRNDVAEIERAGLLGHTRMKHHLQQQIAELVLQVVHIAAIDGIGDLVGFLDGVWGDSGEGLLQVPGAAGLRVAQVGHDGEQVVDVVVGHAGRLTGSRPLSISVTRGRLFVASETNAPNAKAFA